jgi:hypothetical protein
LEAGSWWAMAIDQIRKLAAAGNKTPQPFTPGNAR